MRVHVHNDQDAASFSKFLNDIGDGVYPIHAEMDLITLPENISNVGQDKLTDEIYADITVKWQDYEWLKERSILAPLNETVNTINFDVIQKFPGEVRKYKSIDKTVTIEEATNFPVEFLNSLDIPGLPPHILHLKIGCPVIVLRSLDPPHLTNGTRCIIKQLHSNVLEVQILQGPSAGKTAFIPRIPLIPSDGDHPFVFRRLQFPIRPCFAMTINKAQGQTFKHVGIHLTRHVFSHGMLYVALSRVESHKRLIISTRDRITRNVVFTEIWN